MESSTILDDVWLLTPQFKQRSPQIRTQLIAELTFPERTRRSVSRRSWGYRKRNPNVISPEYVIIEV